MMPSVPRPGMLARVRNRSAVIRSVSEADSGAETTRLVEVEYLDPLMPSDDELLWELEPGSAVLESRSLPDPFAQPPMSERDFLAIQRATRWSSLLPYRPVKAGVRPVIAPLMGAVQVEDYQLVPLARALDMPRVQLGLFDDVGLGKTVEAGLLIAELIRRRRIRRVLVLCPAWLRNQWHDELHSKFGLEFDIVDRQETQNLRRNRGMDANPWRSFPRIIASYHYLRQPDVLQQFESASRSDPRSALLPWDLLIVDEVHNAMPAAHGTDSDLCRVLQQVSRYFEHRIFLSATPHPGFTRSYTGLLEMLDPVRIMRSDTLTAAARERAKKIVVRRLKDEINDNDKAEGRVPRFVQRHIEDPIELTFGSEEHRLILAVEKFRRELKRALRQLDNKYQTAGNFVLETLAKRLLSCPYAFVDSWRRFRAGVLAEEQTEPGDVDVAAKNAREELDDDAESESRIALATELAGMWARSLDLQAVFEEVDQAIRDLGLDPVSAIDGELPTNDARYEALKKFLEEKLGGRSGWNESERLLLFSEYRTTTEYLMRRLRVDFHREPDDRFLTLFGGVPELERERVKDLFNDVQADVRVLVATDAAGEGGNFQQAARLLLHFDLPWNPSRIDQRNGRLDRHGQARDVSVFHFSSEQDADLRFMSRLFGKIEVRRADLGSVTKLFDHAFHQRFIDREPDQLALDGLEAGLEEASAKLRADIDCNTEIGREYREEFEQFCAQCDLTPDNLRETMEVALGIGIGSYQFAPPGDRGRYRMPTIPAAFRDVVNTSLRTEKEALPALQFSIEDQLVTQEGRRIFRPPSDAALMHLGHPLVQRCIAALSKARFPGTEESKLASRWTATEGPLREGLDAEIFVAIEELAMNDLRELVHHWVAVIRFPVQNGALGSPEVQLIPDRAGVRECPGRTEEARNTWDIAQDGIRDYLGTRAKNYSDDIRRHMAEDRRVADQDQRALYRSRKDELERSLSREIGEIRRELENLEKQAVGGLFSSEELAALNPSQKNAEAEMEARREHYRPLLKYLEEENQRLTTLTIPKRYSLRGDMQIFPVTVEIRLPEKGS